MQYHNLIMSAMLLQLPPSFKVIKRHMFDKTDIVILADESGREYTVVLSLIESKIRVGTPNTADQLLKDGGM